MIKVIRYEPETRDFAYSLNGELLGFARTYADAEAALDALVHRLLSAA